MKVSELGNEKAPFGWAAAKDASLKNAIGKSHHTNAKQAQADRMRIVLEMCYNASAVYINYRKKFIAVKVEGNDGFRDRKALRAIEKEWEAALITKCVSKQGFIYRIPA